MARVCGGPHKDSLCVCVKCLSSCVLSVRHTHYQCYRCSTSYSKLCRHNHFNWNVGEVCVHVCVCFQWTSIKQAGIKPFADGKVAKLLTEASNQNHQAILRPR